jgi:sulfhydrogenase subunit beta (sulfur reductase)
MAEPVVETRKFIIAVDALQELLLALQARGYQVIGPTVRDGAVVYEEIASADELPAGWTDEQAPGSYRLRRRDDDAVFGYAVGPHSWKRFLFPPRSVLWRGTRSGSDFEVEEPAAADQPRYAFIGVRSCELRAIEIQDRVFLREGAVDPTYAGRREGAFLVAINCAEAGGTCFCVSMGTGPEAKRGFDLALTEIMEDGRHHFVAEVGSERGAEVLAALAHEPATEGDEVAARAVIERTAASMGRTLDAAGVPELLAGNRESQRWDEVATRCLTCGNCTMVCPTCFCSTVEDTTDLSGDQAERVRSWDSCYSLDFSALGGGPVRSSTRGRYRQWLTHKFSTWVDQFGTSGCVGCGRCITWCPVGIDVTEEIAAIRGLDRSDMRQEDKT